MAVRRVINMGHPTLRNPARGLTHDELNSHGLHSLVEDMVDTLHDYGGIGLAAPQIDEPIALAIIELPGEPTRYGEVPAVPLTVFVNPHTTIIGDETAGHWEGCLSVPGLRGYVERPQHVRVEALNLDGSKFTQDFQGFPATVVQHEFDHLAGRLYIDHITDSTKLVFEKEYERYVAPSLYPALTQE